MSEQHDTIDALMAENRTFPPPDWFKDEALVVGTFLYDEAAQRRRGLLGAPGGRSGAVVATVGHDPRLAAAVRQVVRRRQAQRVGELSRPPRRRRSRRQGRVPLGGRAGRHAHDHLCANCSTRSQRFANVLKGLGVGKGDRVNIYLPMIPEAAVAMLACARIGAPHSVVFGGFSAQSLADRINDAEAKVLVTADGGYRRGEVFPLKPAADEAVAQTSTIEHVVVVKRGGNEVEMVDGRDHWYHDLMQDASPDCPAEPMDSEDLLFLLYTSGTTGKPKGIMHTMGGYLTHVTYTHRVRVRHPPRHRRLLVHRRRRLGDRPQLHRLRAALERGDAGDVRGRPQLPGQRPPVGDRRALRGDQVLHRADRDPDVHEVGRPRARQARSVVAAAAGLGRRADQPRGVDVVPRAHRRRPLPDRRHVVADRDGRDHDQPAPGSDDHQARLGDVPAARRVGRARRRSGPSASSAAAAT